MMVPICTKANVQDRYIHHHDLLLGFAYVFYFIFLLQSYINNKSE